MIASLAKLRAGDRDRAVAPEPSAQGSAERAGEASIELLDLYVRDGLVYYRALKSDRGRLDALRQRRSARPSIDIGAARRADRVLAERLQRARAADGHRPLSDPAALARLPGRAASGRSPARSSGLRTASAGRTLTLDQIEQTILPAFQRSAGVPRARPRRGRQRPPAQRGLHRGHARSAADRGRRASASPARSASRSIAPATECRSARSSPGARRSSSPAYADKAAAGVRHPQPDRARRPRLRRAEAAARPSGTSSTKNDVQGRVHSRSTGRSTT